MSMAVAPTVVVVGLRDPKVMYFVGGWGTTPGHRTGESTGRTAVSPMEKPLQKTCL